MYSDVPSEGNLRRDLPGDSPRLKQHSPTTEQTTGPIRSLPRGSQLSMPSGQSESSAQQQRLR